MFCGDKRVVVKYVSQTFGSEGCIRVAGENGGRDKGGREYKENTRLPCHV